MATPHGKPLALEESQFKFPEVVCALDLETSGKDALKPDRADLAVVGLKVYIWDEQEHSYPPGHYEHYAPTEFLALQQRLDELPGPIIGHNLFNFDYLILRRHLNLEHIVEKTVDTLHFLYEQGGGGEDGSLYQGVALKEKTCVCSLQQASVPSGANSFPLGTPPIRRAPVGIDSGSYHFFVPLPRLCSTGL